MAFFMPRVGNNALRPGANLHLTYVVHLAQWHTIYVFCISHDLRPSIAEKGNIVVGNDLIKYFFVKVDNFCMCVYFVI